LVSIPLKIANKYSIILHFTSWGAVNLDTKLPIERHLEGIANYFFQRTTSGIMEGLNNRIKLIFPQSYGVATFEMMRKKLLERVGRFSILFKRN